MDALILTIESHAPEDLEIPSSLEVVGKGVRIGRKATNDWALPDPTRHISGIHCEIRYENDAYQIVDTSTNGTFLNGAKERIEGVQPLSDGDRIKVGPYVLHAQIKAQVVHRPRAVPPATTSTATGVQTPGGSRGVQAPPGGTSAGQKSVAPRVQAPGGRGTQAPDLSRFPANQAAKVSVPPGARSQPPADPIDAILDATGPAEEEEQQADPVKDTAEAAPAAEPAKPEEPPAPAPGTEDDPFASQAQDPVAPLIPDDFDLDAGSASADAEPTPAPPPAARADGPFGDNSPDLRVRTSLDVNATKAPEAFGERFADSIPPSPKPVVPANAAPKDESDTPAPAETTPEPTAAVPEPTPAAPQPAASAAHTDEFLQGFLKGAGLDAADTGAIPMDELGQIVGQCVRMATSEMMQMLQDRNAVKLFVSQEDRTMRISSGNNPMKFLLDADKAFEALFVTPKDGYMTGADGFDNALTDIRKHQAAMMAAIQPALTDILSGLSPAEVEAGAGGGVMGGGRKNWDEFSKRWKARASQGENGMLDAFVDAFSRRYSEALHNL
ncbi:MAG: type VI secretion system-associated FHA domain protein TagH [Ruegeria sp.]